MALLVPANGGSIHRTIDGSSTFHDVIGPIPERRWIDTVFILLRWPGSAAAGAPIAVGLSIGGSSVAGADGFSAGTSLITRSDVQLLGHPVVAAVMLLEQTVPLVLAIGRQVTSGSSFIQIATRGDPDTDAEITVSVRVLGLALETRERLGVAEEVIFT